MKIRNVLLMTLFVLINLNFIHGQKLEFYGKFEPGTLIIAKGDPVQRAKLNEQELKVDDEGIICFGFDASEIGSQILNIKFKEGKVLLKKISLPGRTYKIQKINNMKKDYVTPP